MLFVMDIGNTNIVFGVYKKDCLLKYWRIRTFNNITNDEFALIVVKLLNDANISTSNVDFTIVSSVVPQITSIINSFCINYFNHYPYWVNIDSFKYISLFTKIPNRLGSDRIINSIAAYKKYKSDLIIIDFGTATTFDVISNQGDYLGGVIIPGIMISLKGLLNKTSQLPYVNIFEEPISVLGKNTITSIQSGMIFGYASLIEGLLKKIIKETNIFPVIIFTGGLSFLIANIIKIPKVIESLLTLYGLKIISKLV